MVKDIKQYLEFSFDIPFRVENVSSHGFPAIRIFPDNDGESLFYVDVYFKDNIRIIIEAAPQRFAASSLEDISNAGEERRRVSSLFASELRKRKAKIDLVINGESVEAEESSSWPKTWSDFRFRMTKIPVRVTGSVEDNTRVILEWSSMVIGMFLALLNVVPISDQYDEEGAQSKITVNKYERSRVNRELCLAANGYNCKICGLNFEEKYGALGRGFIHVHHIVPVSQMGGSYCIDPTIDLLPVCPNCHAMLHRNNPPMQPNKLIEIIKQNEK